MPIYAYRCADCGHAKDVLQKLSDAPLTDCPECGKAALVKMVSAAGFHLKGSGWYVTDYSNKMKPPSEGEKKTEGEKSATTGGEKKETPTGSTASPPTPRPGPTPAEPRRRSDCLTPCAYS